MLFGEVIGNGTQASLKASLSSITGFSTFTTPRPSPWNACQKFPPQAKIPWPVGQGSISVKSSSSIRNWGRTFSTGGRLHYLAKWNGRIQPCVFKHGTNQPMLCCNNFVPSAQNFGRSINIQWWHCPLSCSVLIRGCFCSEIAALLKWLVYSCRYNDAL